MKHDVDGVEHNHTDADYDECLNTLEAFAKNKPALCALDACIKAAKGEPLTLNESRFLALNTMVVGAMVLGPGGTSDAIISTLMGAKTRRGAEGDVDMTGTFPARGSNANN